MRLLAVGHAQVKLWRLIPRAVREQIVLGRIKKLLLKAGLPRGFVEGLMGGWKTWAGSILAISTGIGMVAKEVVDGTFDFGKITTGIGMVAGGLAALGIGHKVDKNTEAVKENTAEIAKP